MTALKNKVQDIFYNIKDTMLNLDNAGIRKLIYFSLFVLMALIYSFTGILFIDTIKDLCVLLLVCNIIINSKPKVDKPENEKCKTREVDKINISVVSKSNDTDENKKYVSVEHLLILLDALILDEVKKETCSHETIAALEDMKNKIAIGAGIEIPQDNFFTPVDSSTLSELMKNLNSESEPENESDAEKPDIEKTADEIVDEVDEIFSAGKRKTPFNQLFMF